TVPSQRDRPSMGGRRARAGCPCCARPPRRRRVFRVRRPGERANGRRGMKMSRSLRYTTFKPGELEARLRELCPPTSFLTPTLGSAAAGKGPLLKQHSFPVVFPDGKEGTCRYERSGPQYHIFWFTYADGAMMPRQTTVHRLSNDFAAIEAKGRELA